MFNRSTKLTALLVAAASVASMTPVMAAEKLNQKDGTIKQAVAYDGGKYVYYGYRSDEDETNIYYNNGSDKDKQMGDDLDNYEITDSKTSKYGTKYVYAEEDGNNDEYLIDISTGKVVDDETAESKQDAATGRLVSALKKVERYNNTSDKEHAIKTSDVNTERLFKSQFGDVWYQYTTATGSQVGTLDSDNGAVATTSAAADETVSGYFGENGNFTGFFDENGKYVDASYTANLRVFNAKKNKATVIEKYGKLYKDEALMLRLKAIKPLAQDKNNLYVLTTVDVDYYDDACNEVQYTDTQYFVQKISKNREKSTGADDAYLPKTVTSYQVDKDKLYEKTDDSYDVYNYLTDSTALYAVKGDYLYVTIMEESDKVHVYKLKLGKDKLDVEDGNIKALIKNSSFSGKEGKDIDTNIVTIKENDDYDAEGGLKAVSIDTEGNTWVIHKGKIAMFDDTKFKDQYSTDRSYDALDVYSKDSLVAWDSNSDSYTTVQEGKKQTVDDAQVIDPNLVNKDTVAPAHTPGWEKQANGVDWKFYDAAGNESTGWIFVGNAWYYIDPATKLMKTGWVQPNGAGTTWYYLDGSGAMKTGWLNLSGTWYYLDGSGAMKTGWFQDYTGTWYYCYSDGSMASNTYVDGYWLNGSGAWVK